MEYIPIIIFCSFLIFLFIVFIKSKDERRNFEKIEFKNKDYFIVTFIYGDADLKTSKGSFFKESDKYVLSCEYDNTVHSIDILKEEIDNFEVCIVPDMEKTTKNLDYNMDYSRTYFSGVANGESVQENGLKIKNVYEFKMNLKNGKKLVFHSKKNPEEFFNRK